MPQVSDLTVSFWSVLVPVVAGFGVCAALVIYTIGRTFQRAQMAGVNELIDLVGRADTPLTPEGRVFVRGEYWNARSDEEIPVQAAVEVTSVEVTAVEGMRLRVRRAILHR